MKVFLVIGTILPEQSVTKALKSPTGRGECETPDTECSDDKLKKVFIFICVISCVLYGLRNLCSILLTKSKNLILHT